jgi:serine/threonine protein kinase/formylglycine-generating enzyme required for sulfatase activity
MEDLTGKQLGQYRIVSPLGEGGMAAVYKAYQAAMDRYVALKILPRHFAADPQFVGRFEQEAKVIAKLQHVHILPVHDFGTEDGYTYIVMPFVETGTIAELLHGKPLPLKQIRKIITQVADALGHAHARGLIHRDVKPSNILIDEDGNSLLTDFGIAKMVEGTVQFTQTGAILGTPAYMSPEQIKGEVLDGRSDIYSLGVVMYEMATGRPPFRAETPPAIFVKHLHDPLPPPRNFNSTLPQSVENVILKCLAKEPKDRYASVAEVIASIHAAIPERSLHETVVESTEVDAGATILEPYVEEPVPLSPTKVEPEQVPLGQPVESVFEQEPSRPPGGLPRSAIIGGAGVIVVGIAIVAFLLLGGNGRGTQDPDRTKTAPTIELEGTLPPTPETTLVVETKVPDQFTDTPAPTEPNPGDLITNPVDGAGLAYIPEGCFMMGATKDDNEYVLERESPVHEVCLDGYWVYLTEVTVDQFSAFVNDTGHLTTAERLGFAIVYTQLEDGDYDWEQTPGAYWRYPRGLDRASAPGNHPVDQVTVADAEAYCQWAGWSLPTEAQWEHAARGPANNLYPWGNTLPTGSLLNLCDSNCPGLDDESPHNDGYARAAPVGSFPPNSFGLYDMAGNVWEWVTDWYGAYSSVKQDNPTGPVSGTERLTRGGSWGYGEGGARSTYRHRLGDEPIETVGFRCVGTLE